MESKFQFTNPSLTNMEFGINEGLCKEDKEINIKINMLVEVNRKEERREARVALKLELGERGDEVPFFLSAVEEANFRWDESVDEESVNILLNQNAPSLLLAYLRPVVTQITSASPFDAFNIPFMNFTE